MKQRLRRFIIKYLPELVPARFSTSFTYGSEAKTNALSGMFVPFGPVPRGWGIEQIMADTGCDRASAEMRMAFKDGGVGHFFQFDHNYSVTDFLVANPDSTEAEAQDKVGWAHRSFASQRSTNPTYISRCVGDPWTPWKVMV